MNFKEPSQPEDNRWHLKREVQVGHIITTVMVASSMLVYAGKLEQRIALVEAQMQLQRDRDERQDAATLDARDELRIQLRVMDQKLDRLIEKGVKP